MRGMHLAHGRCESEASVCCKQVVCIVNVGFAPGLHPLTPPTHLGEGCESLLGLYHSCSSCVRAYLYFCYARSWCLNKTRSLLCSRHVLLWRRNDFSLSLKNRLQCEMWRMWRNYISCYLCVRRVFTTTETRSDSPFALLSVRLCRHCFLKMATVSLSSDFCPVDDPEVKRGLFTLWSHRTKKWKSLHD